MSDDWPRLVGDVGGTNARFAIVERPGAEISQTIVLPSQDFTGLGAALEAYVALTGTLPSSACVAVAGPVLGDDVALTNVAWRFSVEAVRARLRLKRLLVVNDFLALAMAVPGLTSADLLPLGGTTDALGGDGLSTHPKAVIGPGTGLGVAVLVPSVSMASSRVSWSAMATEGGHAGLSPDNSEEAELLTVLRAGDRHVSAERVLSGPGLEALHQALAAIRGRPVQPLRADEILGHGLEGSDPASLATIAFFAGMLGSFAGNVALTVGARDGVYVAGGVAQRLGRWLASSDFRRRFLNKGPMSPYLSAVPTYLITAAQPTFAGAARLMGE